MFIELETLKGEPAFVRVDLIAFVVKHENGTFISLSDGNCLNCKETCEQVVAAVRDCFSVCSAK